MRLIRNVTGVFVAGVLLAAAPAQANAAAAGVAFGGFTPQGLPIVIEVNKKVTKVVRVTIAINLACTSGTTATVPDTYGMGIKKRKFTASFGPDKTSNEDGTTTSLEGHVTGRFNKKRTKASGSWTLTATNRDAAGTVTDTCSSGVVKWSAKQ
jgi:hypothetical protein